ncbi:VanZ family protein [Leptothermofonsia sichuanensis E412]|uniref:VanZ family protein n=1 Tax=Leptothermofonsia sichuanensis TaxID=2917832 RepID=UPI001CA79C45|nr:VanZ family protein [Leptothermofonsia sichuanensis]QZZ20117.1 VanZ family protein [Leptothermofonsia sichuanensis E412]
MQDSSHSFSLTGRAELSAWITRCSLKITILGMLLVVLCTLYPFRFSLEGNLVEAIAQDFWHQTTPLDVLVNMPLFLPLGFGLAGILRKSRLGVSAQLLTILGVSAGLSFTVEFLQLFLPSRAATIADIVTNGLGGVLGAIAFRQWGEGIYLYLLKLKIQGRIVFTRLTVKMLMGAFLSYMVLAFGAMTLLQATTLSSWNPSFPLLLSHNLVGNYPWKGTISQVQIADRAVYQKEARQILAGEMSPRLKGALLADYPLQGKEAYRDRTGQSPDLIWHGKPTAQPLNHIGAMLDRDRWLETTAPVTSLIQRIRRTSQFTLLLTIAPASVEYAIRGGAPILAIARESGDYNFVLGQRGQLLVFWLKTALSETSHDFYQPDGFAGGLITHTGPQRLLISYSGSVLRIYSNRSTDQYTFSLLSTNTRVISLGLLFTPLGILLSLIARKMQGRRILWTGLVCGGILLPPILLELCLIGVTHRNISWENLLLGILIVASALLVFQGTRGLFPGGYNS